MRVYVVRERVWNGAGSSIFVATADGRDIARLRSRSGPVAFTTNEKTVRLRFLNPHFPAAELELVEPATVALVRIMVNPVPIGLAGIADEQKMKTGVKPYILASAEMLDSDEAALEALQDAHPGRAPASLKSRLYYWGLIAFILTVGILRNDLLSIAMVGVGVVLGVAHWLYTARPHKPKRVVHIDLQPDVGDDRETV